jgi:hypothetical protein
VVLAVSPLAASSLRTAFKLCSTSVYTPYRVLYTYFPFRSWWRFLLVSAMFWTIRVCFGLWPTNAGVQPAKRAIVVSTPHTRSMTAYVSGCCCLVYSYSNLRATVQQSLLGNNSVNTFPGNERTRNNGGDVFCAVHAGAV